MEDRAARYDLATGGRSINISQVQSFPLSEHERRASASLTLVRSMNIL